MSTVFNCSKKGHILFSLKFVVGNFSAILREEAMLMRKLHEHSVILWNQCAN